MASSKRSRCSQKSRPEPNKMRWIPSYRPQSYFPWEDLQIDYWEKWDIEWHIERTRRTEMRLVEGRPPLPTPRASSTCSEAISNGSYVEWLGAKTVQSFPGMEPQRTSPARVIRKTGESALSSASLSRTFVWICNGKPLSWAPIRLSSRGAMNPIIPTF